jgi:hypothetical protein
MQHTCFTGNIPGARSCDGVVAMQTPLAELTDQGWQLVIPGTERTSQRKHCLSVAAIEDTGHNAAEADSQGEPMPAKKKRRTKAREQPATIRGEAFKEGLGTVGFTYAVFAARCGLSRITVYRWIVDDTVPPWAAWLLDLLLERRQIAARLETPAE